MNTLTKEVSGCRDWLVMRFDDNVAVLANWVARHPQYYASIRESTLRVASMEPQICASFRKLKQIF